VLVINDMLGMNDRMTPKFVKKYANLSHEIRNAVKHYIQDVKTSAFPDAEHSFK
jgi:3-methyl-2-oxobutanoate hydroxymethyltransferase